MNGELGFSVSYKIRNHIHNRKIVYKNKLGMNSDIEYTDTRRRGEEGQCWIDIEFNVFDLRTISFNENMVTNELDRSILQKVIQRIEEIKKTNVTLDLYSTHLGERILVHVNLAEIECNYRTNGFQSEFFGFTLEFKEESYPGFYKEEEFYETVETIIEENNVHESYTTFVRDFIFRLYRIVDNARKIGSLWVQLGGEKIRIDPVRDINKPDGIYIYRGTGSKPVKIISPDEVTTETLAENGMSKNKLDLESSPHSKLYTNLTKENVTLKTKVKDLEKELIDKGRVYRENITKMADTIARDSFKIEELVRQINRFKESIKENKERDAYIKQSEQIEHKSEVEKLKQNNTKDNIGNFLKVLKDIVPAISGFMKLFV